MPTRIRISGFGGDGNRAVGWHGDNGSFRSGNVSGNARRRLVRKPISTDPKAHNDARRGLADTCFRITDYRQGISVPGRPAFSPGRIVTSTACDHCQLPVGRLGYRRAISGSKRAFCCYGCYLAFQVGRGDFDDAEVAKLLIRLGTGVFLAMNIMLFSLLTYTGALDDSDPALRFKIAVLLTMLSTPLMYVLGGPFISGAVRAARCGRINGDTLVSIGVIAAYSYSVLATIQRQPTMFYDTVAMVLLLFTAGRLLEAIGRAKAARNLEPMFAAEKATACVIESGEQFVRPVDQIVSGDNVQIQPGELIPVDGVVLQGKSECNESMLTGESVEVAKLKGSLVYAGSINLGGRLLIETRAAGLATRWGKICESVRAAIQTESEIHRTLDRVANVFVPFVLLLAIAAVLYWLNHIAAAEALKIGLAVLVVACPCALGLAAPLANTIGLRKAAQGGCLVRSGRLLETLGGVRRIALDKTGTLTQGKASLVDIRAHRAEPDDVIQVAAAAENGLHHPLARAIMAAAQRRGLTLLPSDTVREHPGMGVTAVVGNKKIAVGGAALFESLQWDISRAFESPDLPDEDAATHVFVGWEGSARAILRFVDPLLPEAKDLISELHALGIETRILSGDSPAVTEQLATAIGITHWQAGLTPEDKRVALTRWSDDDHAVAMVGDGLNDAPVLAAAAIGIAVGGATDLARETADVVLPLGRLSRLPWLIRLSRMVQKTIYQNLAWALSYNAVGLLLAVLGLLQPVAAAALMAGSSLLIIVNSLRLDRVAGVA